MEPLAPIPMQQALSVTSGNAESMGSQQVAFAMEHKLGEYIARLQVQGSYGQDLANPAALGGEILKLLKSYMERADKLHDISTKREVT